jgi:DNA mismatch repair protein MutL
MVPNSGIFKFSEFNLTELENEYNLDRSKFAYKTVAIQKLKFLKSNSIEFRHIIDEFQRVALAYENLEFEMFHNDEPIFRLRKTNLMQRIIWTGAPDVLKKLFRSLAQTDWRLHHKTSGVSIGFIICKFKVFDVAGRPVRCPQLSSAAGRAFPG